MKRLIIFLIRKRLGLRRGEHFRFAEQKDRANYYYFDKEDIRKVVVKGDSMSDIPSSVSLNWLLNDKCSIQRSGVFEPMDEVV